MKDNEDNGVLTRPRLASPRAGAHDPRSLSSASAAPTLFLPCLTSCYHMMFYNALNKLLRLIKLEGSLEKRLAIINIGRG